MLIMRELKDLLMVLFLMHDNLLMFDQRLVHSRGSGTVAGQQHCTTNAAAAAAPLTEFDSFLFSAAPLEPACWDLAAALDMIDERDHFLVYVVFVSASVNAG